MTGCTQTLAGRRCWLTFWRSSNVRLLIGMNEGIRMLEQTRKANEANAHHGQRIIEAKRKLGAQIPDMPRRFATMTARVEAQIEQIVRERAQGVLPVPQVEFSQLERIT